MEAPWTSVEIYRYVEISDSKSVYVLMFAYLTIKYRLSFEKWLSTIRTSTAWIYIIVDRVLIQGFNVRKWPMKWFARCVKLSEESNVPEIKSKFHAEQNK